MDSTVMPSPEQATPIVTEGVSEHAANNSEAAAALKQLVSELLAAATTRAAARPVPRSTYRLQLNHNFRFVDAAKIVPYLQKLGISHFYSSPYLKARTGSTHGYDIVDHTSLNPEIGSEAEFEEFVSTLRTHGMGHILDFVPNHMGVGSDENAWWQDVLENGPSSPYSSFFDIDWSPFKPDLAGKVLLPVLGDQFGRVLENQELKLVFANGSFHLLYYGRKFPIAPRSFSLVLKHRLDELARQLGSENPQFSEYQSILTAIGHLPPRESTEAEQRAERLREKEIVKRRLQALCEESLEVAQFIQENVTVFNGTQGDTHSFDLLDELLQDQAYRLSYWRVAAEEINYRRFFDINELAAVCMEQPEVFAKSHSLVLRLILENKLEGLRIDHADGLYDPAGYLRMLQEYRALQLCQDEFNRRFPQQADATDDSSNRISNEPKWDEVEIAARSELSRVTAEVPASPLVHPLYVVVEKILERDERLPEDWAVDGSSGYDFLNDVNALFVDLRNERPIEAIYTRVTGEKHDFDELVYQAKRLIMEVSMSSELNALGHQLDRISECHRLSRDFTLIGLIDALREIVAAFPVYRTYTTTEVVHDRDRLYVEHAVRRAKRRNPAVSHAVFDFVQDVLLLRGPENASDEIRQLSRRFVGRFQQFTGPMMAKAVEDTAFYRYHRLVSLNEVGGDPKRFGITVAAFHQKNIERQARQPHALLATSTHDTKRSEDVRARVNVLSEIPALWKEHLLKWARWNKRKKVKVDGEPAPSRNEEYLLYQTLVGTWPQVAPTGEACDEYVRRIQQYMLKAMREAKVHSSWIGPNEAYEQATLAFVAEILSFDPISAFRSDFEPFMERIIHCGWWNSLSQTLLKLTSPGVPDLYQGTELWDFSLVDPDNRRPVDHAERERLLNELLASQNLPEADRRAVLQELVTKASDGRIKLMVTVEALRLRGECPDLFTIGKYIPIETQGSRAQHLVAFARVWNERAILVVVPRLIASLDLTSGAAPLGHDTWQDTALILPPELKSRTWRDAFSARAFPGGLESLSAADVFQSFPIGLLQS